MKSVILLAPPSAGKGVMGNYLIKNYGYKHLSTGNILREYALKDEELSERLKSGKLIDDETILKILEDYLKNISLDEKIVFDGIPRTLHQAKVLDIMLESLNRLDYVVVYLDVTKDNLLNRVLGRMTCSKCGRTYNSRIDEFKPINEGICDDCKIPLVVRCDDNESSFMVRYQEYLENTEPIKKYYQDKGCLVVIDNNSINQTEALAKLVGVLND